MNDHELEERLQSYYTTFTPESSGRAVAGVDRTLADRRVRRDRPFADRSGRLSLRGVGALAGLAIAVAVVAALFPLWGRTGIGPAGPVGPTSDSVDQAGVARDGAVWAVRGQGLSISRDHGQTWTEHRLPAVELGPNALVVGDADHAWLLDMGGMDAAQVQTACCSVYRTSDGGATWQRTSVPESNGGKSQMSFVNNTVGFVFLDNQVPVQTGGSYDSSTTVVRTQDGGATWEVTATTNELARSVTTADAGTGFQFAVAISAAVAVDANTLWTDCGNRMTPDAACSRAQLRVSRDAGVSWTSVSLPGLADTGTTTPQPNEVQFISPSEGYVAVQETGAGSTRTHYFRTTDGGRTWSEVALVQRQTAWTAPIFLDSQHWFQAGLQNMVVPKAGATDEFVVTPGMNVTSDGGKTWRNVGASMGSLDVVWMSDTLHGATLVGDGPGSHLFLTSDGGETWQAAKIGPAQWPTPSVELVTVPPSGSGVPGASLETAQPANPSIPVVAFPPVESGMPGVAASQAPPFSPPAERSLTPSAAAPSAGASASN